jgi:site-specific DNA-methyltransferase (cytosine-N4-specific)
MSHISLIQGDSYLELLEFSKDYFYSTVTSPPYFGKLDYGHSDQCGLEATVSLYMARMTCIFTEVYRVTVPGGALILNIGDTWNNYSTIRSSMAGTKTARHDPKGLRRKLQSYCPEKSLLNVPSAFSEALRAIGWLHRDTWIWDKGCSGRPRQSDKPASTHEYLMYFRKPTGCKRYTQAFWDFEHWQDESSEQPGSTLHFKAVSSPDGHPCPMPLGLARTLVGCTAPRGSWVLDPFCGSGATLKAAQALGINSVGIDLMADQYEASMKLMTAC